MLVDDIARAKARALDAGEAAIQSIANPAVELSAADLELLRPFLAWCKEKSVRHCPAKPHVVAAFVLDVRNLDTLAAIDRLHQKFGLSNPVLTDIVGAAIERVIARIRRPHWPKADWALWATLPAQIQHRIQAREQQRDTELRRMQNEHAEKLKALTPDEPKQAVTTPKELTDEQVPQG